MIISASNLFNKTITCVSSGHLGFKGSSKSTALVVQYVIDSLLDRLVKKGIKNVFIKFKGIDYKKYIIFRRIKNRRYIRVRGIIDITPIPHNGCRLSKKRRK